MTTRAEIIAAARARIGHRWRHQARADGIAYDCAGLILCVAVAAGVPNAQAAMNDAECHNYGRTPDGRTLLALCEKYLDPVPVAHPADVYLMRFDVFPQHLAILVERQRIVHAYGLSRNVCESGIDGQWRQGIPWRSLIVSAWRFRGIE